ncbi:hypothetical protein BATDEDRAFT_24337 [Batrachochytrium dendrobatidis JAM81]|uniref:Uncharacterized protein n=2 Tax=Batrachochytrium dendrobatidis TaxID=109871 RepID=F4P1P2_BATDJ|nr:uncharacterized protein BATDEDRAFT_24337 [Batrachochytrium dendrobatidis JAM81]EGF80592.1 hypothetical protein BATDEDRAFT_24337 [Batrachochytrium dendrobatidis JAM81]KAK5668617.1 hypothetical protein QVD99_004411 [Batrachochytrium dendrobatidis]OAJ41507.1 hypothetical protein BDEG_25090 [Batrachochytrium dendrobatidis JEL423]|eukprot:XP_006678415.1 hypothetical protein BATDEDRAFT_24337 [Batrachochytrium dendrobatidis JAM81]
MKLAVAVLSSILFACSVTIANPVKPSETTSTKSSTSPTPNPKGIGLGGLDPLPDIIKELLDKHLKLGHDLNQQGKICDPLQSEYENQQKLIKDLEKRIRLLEFISQTSGDNQKYYGEIQETKLNLEAQRSKLFDFGSRYYECQLKTCYIELDLSLIKIELVDIIFGGPWDSKSTDRKLFLIGTYPSVMRYFGELGNKGQSSGRNKSLGQNHGDQQQHQDSQPSPNTPSGSGSPGQKVPSNRQKGSCKFMNGLKSFFQRSKNDDSSN